MSIETTVREPVQDTQLITADAAAKLIEEGALLIDVRSEGGRASTGAVPGAVVVNREHVEEDFSLESAHRLPQVTGKDQKIVVFCGSVNGSRPVAQKLQVLGYANAVHVDGGFPALRNAGVPTTGPTAPPVETAPPAATTQASNESVTSER
ncbi:rhodanese-like domain-containing protein [Paenarthrobacter ilicis]|uniref:Rhodanese-related sulfurtransferase n=1 Tax=Paenarthrobacter ilicis TaxID=43665 RepID=A0ABX0TN90_9MICC|nr:rhodanese-like domain-containing protein [Paenarthrobacter ilicis]MBM7793077.1 rhodanese-related sulfurtransferase [Paenarthrobacter ilicis]NIJ02147.1 rhodanese-related sulfurtransferase [Paenarthrobacter ilicis]